MSKDIATTIPFSGFYNSWHSDEIDTTLSRMFEDDHGNTPTMFNNAWETIDYSAAYKEYAKEYMTAFADEFNLSLKFDELNSPKEYNFTTDRIFAFINQQDINRMLDDIDLENLNDKIKQKFSSYDGLRSHYPNALNKWPKNVSEWDHNQIGTLIETYIEHQLNDIFDSYQELHLMEYAQDNSIINSIIYDNMNKEGHRMLKIADYLRTRNDRKFLN